MKATNETVEVIYAKEYGRPRKYNDSYDLVECPYKGAWNDKNFLVTSLGDNWGFEVRLVGSNGAVVAEALIGPLQDSPIPTTYRLDKAKLASTAFLADFRVLKSEPMVQNLLAYAVARRGRILGFTAISACIGHSPLVEQLLSLQPISNVEQGPHGAFMAQRIDLAAYRTWQALDADRRPCNGVLGAEVRETAERWLESIQDTSFFMAVRDRTLTQDQYAYTLSHMHAFVRWTTRLVGKAISVSHDIDIRNEFLQHMSEEINHELILEKDLAHMGEDVSYVTNVLVPNPGTRAFMANQEALVGFSNDPLLFMASPLAAEGIGSHVDASFMENLNACVSSWGIDKPGRATNFWKSHISFDGGDHGHWLRTLEMVSRKLTGEAHLQDFLTNLRTSQNGLTDAYNSYVDDVAIFSAGLPAKA